MKKFFQKLLFPVIGTGSLIWFLVRVIPKPSRATYPCMRVAAPIASSFVIYIMTLLSSILFFKKARKYLYESRYVMFAVALFVAIALGLFSHMQNNKKLYAVTKTTLEEPNQPMGTGKGIYPGRVVWVYNHDATDETCQNNQNDYWFQDDNANQSVISNMLSKGLQNMTGETSDAAAWNAIFHYYNQNHGKGDVGYTAGEKIVIKINLNGEGNTNSAANINTCPQLCYAILDQLTNAAGVAQADIGIGDPSHMSYGGGWWPKPSMEYYLDKCETAFPNVKYWGNGMTATPPTAENVMFAADGSVSDPLPQCYIDAAYMINIPVLKKHHRAGISLCCKNHFGTTAPYTDGAWQWHPSLPCPEADGEVTQGNYGVYRCFVDIMGHKDLGGKTILYLVDGIWSSVNWGHPPIKWRMPPFNNDWPSSLFLSQDPVAIESVGFDFLYYEFDENHPTEGGAPNGDKGPYPHFAAVDDYLHQAADSTNWPSDIIYDPENDGTPLPRSMGVHEHWNNAVDKKYTKNLGTGDGIELVSVFVTNAIAPQDEEIGSLANNFSLNQNYPNPFNATTTIQFNLPVSAYVSLTIYNIRGQQIRTLLADNKTSGQYVQSWDGLTDNGGLAPSGIYFYKLQVKNNGRSLEKVQKMVLNR